jgi:hypothetical protein
MRLTALKLSLNIFREIQLRNNWIEWLKSIFYDIFSGTDEDGWLSLDSCFFVQDSISYAFVLQEGIEQD